MSRLDDMSIGIRINKSAAYATPMKKIISAATEIRSKAKKDSSSDKAKSEASASQ